MSAARRRPEPLHKCTCLRDSHTCTIRYLSRLTTYRSAAIPAGRGLGRPDLPGTKRQAAISYVWGRRERAQPGLNAAAFPLKVTVYTIHIVKEQIGAQKNPGWFEPAGVSLLELPWKVRCSSLPETICGRLKSSVPHYSWRAHQYGQTPYARVSGTDVHRRRRYSWRVIANACERRLKT
jgi:hypothetical protein